MISVNKKTNIQSANAAALLAIFGSALRRSADSSIDTHPVTNDPSYTRIIVYFAEFGLYTTIGGKVVISVTDIKFFCNARAAFRLCGKFFKLSTIFRLIFRLAGGITCE